MALVALAVVAGALLCVHPALAETNGSAPSFPESSTIPTLYRTQSCFCHANWGTELADSGPHGGYTATTDSCVICHTIHDASGGTVTFPEKPASTDSVKLLPAATIADSCVMCHDGTGGSGVYGTIAARGLGQPAGGHRSYPETTNVVPGGAADGGGATVAFDGKDGMMTCSDCHSPHGSNLVTPFEGDHVRNSYITYNSGPRFEVPIMSSRLLKQKPTSAESTVAEYGSAWCAGCHTGRHSGGTVNNHPVESDGTDAGAFAYQTAAGVPAVSTGIACDSAGNVYVCDPGNRRVEEFTSAGAYVRSWTGGGTDGRTGNVVPPLSWPAGVTVIDGARWINATNDGWETGTLMYVSDALYGIMEFHNGTFWGLAGNGIGFADSGELPAGVVAVPWGLPDYELFTSFAGLCTVDVLADYDEDNVNGTEPRYYWRSSVATAGLNGPMGLAKGPNDAGGYGAPIYVADTFNDRIIRSHYSSGSYTIQGIFGTKGTGNGQFDHPGSVACDAAGNVYVADGMNDRVQKFTSAGTYITQWGTSGTGNGQFDWPDGVAVDSAGSVYVADRSNDRVQKFTSTGTYVAQWGTKGSGSGQFQFNGSFSGKQSSAAPGSNGYPYTGLGTGNGGYLMSDPRTPTQQGHAPVCQQCHEDARDPGQLKNGEAVPAPFKPSADGILASGAPAYGNPRFQDFPHETQNADMLVETGDDLCLNCHSVKRLP